MSRQDAEDSPTSPRGSDRRAFLRNAGLAGAGAAALGPLTAGTASAASSTTDTSSAASAGAGRWNPDTESLQFTLAVMPDTQFMYWGGQGSVNTEPQEASFRYIIDNSGEASGQNIVFFSHLGDLTEDGEASSYQYVDKAFDILDSHGVAYSVLAGNHDVSGDDTRGATPYLQTMGPQRFANSPTFVGADSTGYNTAHIFRAAAASGCCSRWTGGCRSRASPGPTSIIKAVPEAAGDPHHARDRRPDSTMTTFTRTSRATRTTTPRCPATARRCGTA
jgi:hypothetical protein